MRASAEDTQICDILKPNISSCEVCGIGGLFVGALMKFDGLRAVEAPILSFTAMCDHLLKYFSEAQLKLVEDAFEGWNKLQEYYSQYPKDKQRLAAIMKNIIRNKGTFKPFQDIPKE